MVSACRHISYQVSCVILYKDLENEKSKLVFCLFFDMRDLVLHLELLEIQLSKTNYTNFHNHNNIVKFQNIEYKMMDSIVSIIELVGAWLLYNATLLKATLELHEKSSSWVQFKINTVHVINPILKKLFSLVAHPSIKNIFRKRRIKNIKKYIRM